MESLPVIPASSIWIGEDLWSQIFKKLPIQCLGRCRCVSKSWNSLISTAFFINSFPSSTTSADQKSYLRVNFRDRHHNYYVVHHPQGSLTKRSPVELHFLFRFCDSRALNCFTFVGVIHGVVCVSYSLNSSFDSAILWNPTIHKYVTLPSLPFPVDLGDAKALVDDVDDFDSTTRFDSNAIGFGFDSSKNDFKVIRIWIPSSSVEWPSNPPPPIYELYSAQQGTWRVSTADHINLKSCKFNTSGIKSSRTGCFLNGTIHWLISSYSDGHVFSILMFDCEHDEFTRMDLPKEVYLNEATSSGPLKPKAELLEYDGKLAALVYSCLSWQREIEMWVMEEYGVASSWKKLFRIPDGLKFNLNDERFVNQSLLGKLAPNGPNEWIKCVWNVERFDEMLSYHVYEESMFLMDDAKAQSYTKKEIVHI